MTVEEIFSQLSAHTIRGMMIHEGMANYYDFLGLHGFKRLHEYHYLSETLMNRKVQRFFINRYNKLIPESNVDSSSVIPATWYKTTRQAVDKSTKRAAVESGMIEWVNWEKETCELYSRMYMELEAKGEIPAAQFLCDMVKAVAKELKKAERMHLKFESTDYDMTYIVESQHWLHEKFKKKTKEIRYEKL